MELKQELLTFTWVYVPTWNCSSKTLSACLFYRLSVCDCSHTWTETLDMFCHVNVLQASVKSVIHVQMTPLGPVLWSMTGTGWGLYRAVPSLLFPWLQFHSIVVTFMTCRMISRIICAKQLQSLDPETRNPPLTPVRSFKNLFSHQSVSIEHFRNGM